MTVDLAGVRVLTVKPPWSWAIIHGGKLVENRTTNWHHRGPLLIHAGAGWSERGANSPLMAAARRRLRDALPVGERLDPWALGDEPVQGAVIGLVDLVDVHASGPCAEPGGPCHPWGESSYQEASGRRRTVDVVHLVLENPRPLPTPVAATGRLGLWTPDPDLLAEVTEQLETLNP